MCSSTNNEHTRAGVLRTPTKQRSKGDHAKRSPERFTQSTKNRKQENTPRISYQLKPATLPLQKITQRYQFLTSHQNVQQEKENTK